MLKYIFLLLPFIGQAQDSLYQDKVPMNYYFDRLATQQIIDDIGKDLDLYSFNAKTSLSLFCDTTYYDPKENKMYSEVPESWPIYRDSVDVDTIGSEELEEYLYFSKDSSIYYTIINYGDYSTVLKEKQLDLTDVTRSNSYYSPYRFNPGPITFYVVIADEEGKQQEYIKIEANGDIIIFTDGHETILKNTSLGKNVWKNVNRY